MQIQLNTGRNINFHETPAADISGILENTLSRFSDHITRLEVHLSDENSDKKVGHDAMRCMMEARLEGHQPLAVTYQAASLNLAVNGAADKLARVIQNTLGRRRKQQSRRTDPDPSLPEPELEKES